MVEKYLRVKDILNKFNMKIDGLTREVLDMDLLGAVSVNGLLLSIEDFYDYRYGYTFEDLPAHEFIARSGSTEYVVAVSVESEVDYLSLTVSDDKQPFDFYRSWNRWGIPSSKS